MAVRASGHEVTGVGDGQQRADVQDDGVIGLRKLRQ